MGILNFLVNLEFFNGNIKIIITNYKIDDTKLLNQELQISIKIAQYFKLINNFNNIYKFNENILYKNKLISAYNKLIKVFWSNLESFMANAPFYGKQNRIKKLNKIE